MGNFKINFSEKQKLRALNDFIYEFIEHEVLCSISHVDGVILPEYNKLMDEIRKSSKDDYWKAEIILARIDFLNNINGMEYNDYLSSSHWDEKRNTMLSKECAVCCSKSSLQLHHRHYKNIGNESASDLITLCESCHKLFHENKRKSK